jgi:hypothetical protein
LPRSADLPTFIVRTIAASQDFGKSLPFAAATESRTTSVTFCDVASRLLCSRWRIRQLGAQIETLDRLCLARRARTSPLPEFYNMPIVLIPTTAVVPL